LCLVIHRQEGKSTTNTGLLAAQILPGSRVLWRGGREDPPLAPDQLLSAGLEPLLLFPGEGAEVVDEAWLAAEHARAGPRRYTLIVPDGTWGQASRVGRREPALAPVRRVTLAPGPLSEYRLRREHDDAHVCTFEAIARLLGVLEGQATRDSLELLFRKFVGRQLWGAGKLEAREVPGGIPEAAIHERAVSGYPSKW
jgi:DTW domain-containing protein YfiP